MRGHTHTRTHARAHAHARTHARTHTHTHTHTHQFDQDLVIQIHAGWRKTNVLTADLKVLIAAVFLICGHSCQFQTVVCTFGYTWTTKQTGRAFEVWDQGQRYAGYRRKNCTSQSGKVSLSETKRCCSFLWSQIWGTVEQFWFDEVQRIPFSQDIRTLYPRQIKVQEM